MRDITDEVETVYNNFGSRLILISDSFKKDGGIGYCYKSGNYYTVFTADLSNDFMNKCIKMHEYGHIYFGHLDGMSEYLDNKIMELISSNYDDLVERINTNCNIDYADELLDKIIVDSGYNHMIHNISMDLEVNSKILNETEVRSLESHILSLRNPDSKEAKKDKIKLMYPTDYGFEEQLSYPEYLILVILNLDKFIEKIVSILIGSGDGEGEGTDHSKEEGLKDGTVIPKTMNELDEVLSDAMDRSREEEAKSGDNERIDHDSESRERQDKKRKDGEILSEGGNGYGSSSSIATRKVIVNDDPLEMGLEDIIKEFRSRVIKRKYARNFTYKYNRGIDRSLISPTYRQKLVKSEEPTIVFGIDVSGSMDTSLVDRCLRTISRNIKRISASLKYNIITWDTKLCEHFRDINPKDKIPDISYGGGTNLARLFPYYKKNYGKDAILIIISDFEDSLNAWKIEEEKMNGYSMYGFDYGGNSKLVTFKNLKVKICKSHY